MKKMIDREIAIRCSEYSGLFYADFFKQIEDVKQLLTKHGVAFGEYQVETRVSENFCDCYERCDCDRWDKDSIRLVFKYKSLETDKEYEARLKHEEKLSKAAEKRKIALAKASKTKAKKKQEEEKKLYEKLKEKFG